MRGAEMALSDLKESTIEHKFLFQDSQYDKKQAVSGAQKLLNVDQVDVLVSLWETAEAVAPLAERADKLHASIRWNSDTSERYKNTFTFESTYKDYAKAFVKLFKKQGITKVALLGQEAEGWNLLTKVFIEEASKQGITVSSEQTYLPGESEFRGYALRLMQSKPEIVLVNDVAQSLELVTRAIKTISPQLRVTGYLEYPMDLSLFENESYIAQLQTDPKFEERFLERYKEPIYVRAQVAYDLVSIIAATFSKSATKPSNADVVNALKNVGTTQGASGRINVINSGKVFQTEVREMQIRGGKRVMVE